MSLIIIFKNRNHSMKALIVAGPPSSGKTSVVAHMARRLASGEKAAVVKFDAQSSADPDFYRERLGIPALGGMSGYLCPDHYFISNMEEALDWGASMQATWLFIETAGLCLRCAPHIEGVPAVTVVDCLGGVRTPAKMGPMLALADIVILTKGDLVSQAERETIAFGVRSVNPAAALCPVNGLVGTGALGALRAIRALDDTASFEGRKLRHDMPAAICSYCTGERRVGRRFQAGSVEKLWERQIQGKGENDGSTA
jgi:Ni2+-binding GTPase involved in maturation of urease and hydrogenase